MSVDGYLPRNRLPQIRMAETIHNDAWTALQFAMAEADSVGPRDGLAGRVRAARESIDRR